MKKIITILAALLLAVTMSAQVPPQKGGAPPKGGTMPKEKKQKKEKTGNAELMEAGTLYVYGVALSPTDSVVYVTDELLLEKAQMYKKTKFLYGRDIMSRQLASHMADKGEKNRICSVTFAASVKQLDKLYAKQIKKLENRGYLVKHVDQGDFRFVTVRED